MITGILKERKTLFFEPFYHIQLQYLFLLNTFILCTCTSNIFSISWTLFFNVPLLHTFQDLVDTSGFYTQSFCKTLSYLINQAYSCSVTTTHTNTVRHFFTHSVSLSYFPEDFFSVFINFELPSLSFSHTWVSFFVRIPWKQMWLGLLYICTYIQNEHFLCLPICLPFHFWRIEHYYVFSQVNVQYNKSPHVGRLIKEILVHIWNASSFKWHKSCI